MKWIVRLGEQGVCYGPFTDEDVATGFAAYLTAEVDPASVVRLSEPVTELLSFYGQFMARQAAEEAKAAAS